MNTQGSAVAAAMMSDWRAVRSASDRSCSVQGMSTSRRVESAVRYADDRGDFGAPTLARHHHIAQHRFLVQTGAVRQIATVQTGCTTGVWAADREAIGTSAAQPIRECRTASIIFGEPVGRVLARAATRCEVPHGTSRDVRAPGIATDFRRESARGCCSHVSAHTRRGQTESPTLSRLS